MSALICGSIAYDTIMVFEDSFKNHILPDQIHILNVAFLVPKMRREFGGCAMNIAYNLKLLGQDPLPMATAGKDFAPYRDWLERQGIRQDYIRVVDNVFTAQAFITTDLDANQITAFHPGAMNESHLNRVSDAQDVTIGIVSPDGRDGMLAHATQFAAAEIPFIFDPGQGLQMFDGDELRQFVEQATWVTVNDYEWQVLKERTGWDVGDFKQRLKGLIVTRGAKGSMIYTPATDLEIPAAKPATVSDPTGCGDAYRAGLLFGLMAGYDWSTVGRVASLLGAIKIECHGTQNHRFTREEFQERFQASFGEPLTE
ncbi:MAG: carbohydrate kinase family protein [Gammaproteobacteria bacterium]|nr:carbohydrate kinase family protein [Gammaproteobacteria bacterium]